MTTFADFYPLTAFSKAENETPLISNKSCEVFNDALHAFMIQLVADGRIIPAPDYGDREIAVLTTWDKIITGEKHIRPGRIALPALSHACKTIAYTGAYACNTNASTSTKMAWRNLVKVIDAGDASITSSGWPMADHMEDFRTGEKVFIELRDWKLSLFTRNDNDELVPLTVVKPFLSETVSFAAPSGQLILTDTLKFGKFYETTKFSAAAEFDLLSLNNDRGCVERSKAHAAQHGFGFVQTTNTVVAVLRNEEGVLAIISKWTDKGGDLPLSKIPGWTCLGEFDCDIWRITAIDPATAAKLADQPVALSLGQPGRFIGNAVMVDWPSETVTMTVGPDLSRIRKEIGLPKKAHLWTVLHP